MNILALLFSDAFMYILLAVYIILTVINIFKRGFLSSPAVYWITMLFVPYTTVWSAFVLLDTGLTADIRSIIFLALNILSCVIYVRGQFFPVNEELKKYAKNPELYSARRLIAVGIADTFVGLVFLGEIIYENYLTASKYNAAEIHEEDMTGMIMLITLIIVALTFIPAELTVLNGCIKYIRAAYKTKLQKAVFMVISFIPVLNIIYSIYCLTKISQNLKKDVY